MLAGHILAGGVALLLIILATPLASLGDLEAAKSRERFCLGVNVLPPIAFFIHCLFGGSVQSCIRGYLHTNKFAICEEREKEGGAWKTDCPKSFSSACCHLLIAGCLLF
jgi:hypothetical protein